MAGFLGMRGTGSWATDQRPKSWREGILYLYPNGSAPLTAIMSMLKSEKVDDPEFYWWTKTLPAQRATITGIYTDVLSTGYTTGGSAGDTLYVKMSEADAYQFKPGHQVLLRDADHYDVDVNARVTAVTKNGASSYLTVKLLEDDDNGATTNLSNADVCLIIGNINEEGATMPSAISYDPSKLYNYTQILRTSLSITRTARKTRLRTGDAYREMKREALELHSIEMEKALIFGVKSENTGDGGYPIRTMDGIIPIIKANASANVNNFALNASYSGKAWMDDGGGEDWLDAYLEVLFRYGSTERLCLCGSGTLQAINRLAKAGSHLQLTPQTKAYGIQVVEWITPFGTVYFKTHPIFSQEATLRNSGLFLDTGKLKYRYIDDTAFYGEGQAKQAAPGTNVSRKDGTDEEWLTECSLELHHPSCFMYLDGFGQDNSV